MLLESLCVVQICLVFLHRKQKNVPGEKKKNGKLWPLRFSSLIFLCSQGQSCASTYWAEQRILNV